jgi:soluble lytic murein transglycosylase
VWRRRLILAAGLAAVIVAVVSLVRPVDHAVEEIKLPLRHEDIIRQQAADKRVDAALIAAVIYTESHFRDQTSHAGAKGLMQLMPETADYIARKSGGTRFERADLEWWAAASSRGEKFRVADHIPFPETRDYVHRVLSARRDYRRSYARELGL